MFQFMRKGEKDKAEKKPGKQPTPSTGSEGNGKGSFSKKVKDKLGPDDLHRLDEIRRSFKLGKAKKEKQKLPSGIIADYSENFMHPPVQQSVTMPSLRAAYSESSYPDQGYGVSVSVSHSDSNESSLSAKSLNLPVPPVASSHLPPPEIPGTLRQIATQDVLKMVIKMLL